MEKTFNSIRQVFKFYMIIFFILGLYIAYIMGVESYTLLKDPKNPRNQEILSRRGKIYSRSGKVIAVSKKVSGRYKRFYPKGFIYEPLLGYFSRRYGKSGLEKKIDPYLKGKNCGKGILELLTRHKPRGCDVYLTLDEDLQKISSQQLQGVKGAVVVINPQTGEILALASSPSYNPNEINKEWKRISQGKDAPLILRGVNGYYPPGSTLKIFTLGALYEEGLIEPYTTFNCTGDFAIPYDLGIYHVHDAGGFSHGLITAKKALEKSCNIAFAKMGLKLGAYNFVKYSKKFGLNSRPNFFLAEKSPDFPKVSQLTPSQLAQVAFGQGKILLSPLHIALMASAYATDGKIYEPQIIKAIIDEKGKIIKTFKRKIWKEPISPSTALKVREAMIGVVERGTGKRAQILGIRVAGKTGSAENANYKTHAWFVCFSPDIPKVLVVVIVEEKGYGGIEAAPRARAVLEKAIKKYCVNKRIIKSK